MCLAHARAFGAEDRPIRGFQKQESSSRARVALLWTLPARPFAFRNRFDLRPGFGPEKIELSCESGAAPEIPGANLSQKSLFFIFRLGFERQESSSRARVALRGACWASKNATVSYFGFIFGFPCGFRAARTALPCESGDCTDFSGALGRQILSLFMGFCVIRRVKCSCFMGFCVIRLVECPCFMGYFAIRLIEYTRFMGFCAIWGYRKLQTEASVDYNLRIVFPELSRAPQSCPDLQKASCLTNFVDKTPPFPELPRAPQRSPELPRAPQTSKRPVA